MIQKEKLCVTCSTKNSPTHAASTFLNATPKRTSKTEVLQTPSAIEVNLGQGVK